MRNCAAAFILGIGLFILPLSAQQTVPFRNGIPVAPPGVPVPPLPDKPVEYQTGEGQHIRVVVVARGLSHPWGLAFLPDGAMLVTERTGKLRIIRNGILDPEPVAYLLSEPPVYAVSSTYCCIRVLPRTVSCISPTTNREASEALCWRLRAASGTAARWRKSTTSSSPATTQTVFRAWSSAAMECSTSARSALKEPTRKIQTAMPGKCCGYATTAPHRRTIHSLASPDTSRRSIRSDIAARKVWRCIRAPVRSGRSKWVRTAATNSTCCGRAPTAESTCSPIGTEWSRRFWAMMAP